MKRFLKWKTLTAALMAAAAITAGTACVTLAKPVTVEAAGRPVAISSCLISGGNVVCRLDASSTGSLTSDDGKFYVYANEVYLDGPTGDVVATADIGSSVSVSFPLNYNTADSNLSRKFLVAIKRGGEMIQVSDEHYITNPEAIAAFTSPRHDIGIKGLYPGSIILSPEEIQDLGIQQVIYNLDMGGISVDASVPGAIPFNYNGQTYYFNKGQMEYYDSVVQTYNSCGVQVTLVLLNSGLSPYGQDLIHPMAADGAAANICPGYALNVADSTGTNHIKAISTFLGQRYSGQTGNGQVDNWIVGNEVNARTSWWYTNSDSLDENVSLYVKAFRIVYNELKSQNANVRVYNSIDQEWNRQSGPGCFLSKAYLDQFNYYMNREGNIDWSLSFHPYNSPLYDPYAWNGPAVWVQDSLTTPYMTMQNLDILISYMHQPEFLNPSGQVRSISLAEIGYTSAFGTAEQEASIAYGYLKAASLPDVDSFMLFRHTDNAHEMESHLALGLYDLNGNKKPAYDIYKNLGTANAGIAKARASEIIGMDIDQMISQNIMWTRQGTTGVR